ncbi:dTDP-4-amino-4,6-dideoxygalactose transaminase [Deefgea piscis]|uniref:dTDP-4-amino-4,6-dideoxygalactose transaminase n=1 Tax=Deefgea piscis TaxID=2739061 RepID=UPI0021051548|nr:dTDP-4-amino-4,6-dideoxygalactose transaminase [Deefgea piscis]
MSKIPFGKPFIVGKELFYIAQAVINGSISGDGLFTRRCQEWLETELHCKKVLLTQSCTAALEMTAILANIGPGDEVIMPSFTFVSTANAFVLRGGVPVFVDIRQDTLNIDERLVESAITERTKAIVVVHYAGQPCEMSVFESICRKYNLFLVEDAAQAILASDGSRALGTIGDMGCVSFHETKNIISGEGGALLINNPELIERAEIIWHKGTNRKAFYQGQVDKYTWVDIGSSFLPSELTAAFLFAQLEQAKRINSNRRSLFEKYLNILQPLANEGFFSLPYTREGLLSNGHVFYIICKNDIERQNLISYLAEQGINAVFHYVPLHNSPAGMRFGRTAGELNVTEDISRRLLRLPMFSEMSHVQVRYICQHLALFYHAKN